MRLRRLIASVLLTVFVSGSGGAWFITGHQFNDDPDCDLILTGDVGATPRLQSEQVRDSHHCEICHLFRSLRTASRSVAPRVGPDVRQVAAVATIDPRIRVASLRALGARAPPVSFL